MYHFICDKVESGGLVKVNMIADKPCPVRFFISNAVQSVQVSTCSSNETLTDTPLCYTSDLASLNANRWTQTGVVSAFRVIIVACDYSAVLLSVLQHTNDANDL